MKKLPLITTLCVLAISIQAAYLGFKAYNNRGFDRVAETDFGNELALVKSEISALKKTSAELNELKQKMTQLELQRGNNGLQAKNKNAGENVHAQQDIAQELPKSPDEMAQNLEEQNSKELELFNNTFLAESSDQQWAPETTHLVTSFF